MYIPSLWHFGQALPELSPKSMPSFPDSGPAWLGFDSRGHRSKTVSDLKHIETWCRTSPFVGELVLPYQSTIWEGHLVGRTDLDPYTTPQVFESGEVKIFPHLFQSEDLGWDQAPFRNPWWHSMWQDLWGKGFRHASMIHSSVLLYGLKGQTPYVLTTGCNLGPSRPNNGQYHLEVERKW